MLPFFVVGDIRIYTFGITLIICAIIFIAFLRKLSHRLEMNFRFFSRNFLVLLIAILVFGRIFYFLDHPGDWSYGLRYWLEVLFFSPSYHFSLIGAIIWFLGVLLWKVESFWLKKEKYLDISVISFLSAYTIGAIGGFVSETIYGTPTHLAIGLSYNNPITTVPLGGDLIPLGLIYSIVSFFIAFGVYALRRTSQIDGVSAYIGIVCWSSMLFIGEFFNGERLSLSLFFGVFSLTQIGAVILIIVSLFMLYRDVLIWAQKKLFK